ncbi:hypothetical protein X924_02175 [Petrotoga sp. 9PWA.NaAc.5.4]|nr:hypothetical protein X924_02175 [Petrotoga sp. 9PWA.NaAc.5.4]
MKNFTKVEYKDKVCINKMDLLYYENYKNCSYFVPTYKRKGTYFTTSIDGLQIEANYEPLENGVIKISRFGKNFKKSYWLHIYAAYYHFKEKDENLKRIILETLNATYEVNYSDILLREKWIKKELNNLKNTRKTHGSHCKFCKIKKSCHLEFLKQGDFSVVPNFSQQVVEQLNKMNLDPITVIATDQIEKLDKKFRKPLYNLRSLIKDETFVVGKYIFPNDYIVFDVETYMNKDFLFGFLDNDDYYPFFIGNNGAKTIHKMIDFLYSKDKFLIHYDKNDIKALNKFTFNYPDLKGKIRKIISKSVDLFEIVNENYTLPVVSYSLKDISKYFGFEWKTELNGFAVIIEYRAYLKGDKEALKRIFKYNEQDCRATKLVIEKLKNITNNENA